MLGTLMGYMLFTGLRTMLEDEEEPQNKPSQVKEAVRQVKKAADGEKLGPEADVDLVTKGPQTEEVADDEDIVPDEQPEDAIFIPVAWPQKRPREFYKGTDPEWQSFMELARNEKRRRQLQGVLDIYYRKKAGTLTDE